ADGARHAPGGVLRGGHRPRALRQPRRVLRPVGQARSERAGLSIRRPVRPVRGQLRPARPGARAALTRLLCYCANVRPGETLAEVLAACRDVAGAVRRELLADRLGLGLWLSQSAL